LVVGIGVAGLPILLERLYSILIGAIDACSSISPAEDSKADAISGGSGRRSWYLIAKGFTRIASPPCDSSTVTSSSSFSSTGLDAAALDTP
jgi:hypothetical protein